MNNNNNTNGYVQDEREIQNNDKALAGAAVVSIICNFGLMIYGLVKDDLRTGGIALIQIILMGIVIAIIKRKKGDINIPTTISGKKVSTEMTKKGRLNRIGYCALESLGFCIGYTLIDVLLSSDLFIPGLAVQFVILFIVSFVFEFLLLKSKVKKYNKLMAELENEDEDIDE